ncbi:hypothetical protein D9619_012958 [Psilocybe cf. subviscida]|uniref:Uncharacterized protein n=1 Tax=Psilocybe cf. subviscida TaxID=2480587 RepID=A0A8H5F4Q0_9AGAR|nr:hypothetical protein D9619_012958 [Psilocybe cf. subviscida]
MCHRPIPPQLHSPTMLSRNATAPGRGKSSLTRKTSTKVPGLTLIHASDAVVTTTGPLLAPTLSILFGKYLLFQSHRRHTASGALEEITLPMKPSPDTFSLVLSTSATIADRGVTSPMTAPPRQKPGPATDVLKYSDFSALSRDCPNDATVGAFSAEVSGGSSASVGYRPSSKAQQSRWCVSSCSSEVIAPTYVVSGKATLAAILDTLVVTAATNPGALTAPASATSAASAPIPRSVRATGAALRDISRVTAPELAPLRALPKTPRTLQPSP